MLDKLVNLDPDVFIVIASALAAALSFAAFSFPLLRRFEQKEHYREVIEKKRRTLFEQAREQAAKGPTPGVKTRISAAQSIAALYKLQALAGDLSVQARAQLLQAGIRSTTAPLVYLGIRAFLPLLFMGMGFLFVQFSQKPLAPGVPFLIICGAAAAGFYLPRILIKNMSDKRQQEISLSFPDALDMILICVQGGIGIEAAINRIGQTIAENSEILAEEMGILSAELGMLNDRKAAYQGFAVRAGSGAARSFVAAMLQAEQYGTSISRAMRVLADETREKRMALAEQKAASLPPKLTVPMILFFLPPLFIVILGPAFIGMP